MEKTKKQKKISKPVIILIIAGILLICYFFPLKMLKAESSDIAYIDVFNGNTGKHFVVSEQDQVNHIVDNLSSKWVIRTLPKLPSSGGFGFVLVFYDTNNNVCAKMTMNSKSTILTGIFYHNSLTSSLCYDYLKELETELGQ